MEMFKGVKAVYLHREFVDFRKSINGLSLIVEESMQQPLFDGSLFVFCNRRRDKLKIIYWDNSGFALWYKRLEKDKFKWPKKHAKACISLNEEQLNWLLNGYDILKIQGHKKLNYKSIK